jgi:hypothetical protein
MNLQRGLGDIDSDIDNSSVWLHIIDRVLTHPYKYELPAEAGALTTVRVWSTGRVRLKLGCGLVDDRPRVERARTRHRCPVRRGSGLSFLRRQENQKRKG